jgi:hypothetical protein
MNAPEADQPIPHYYRPGEVRALRDYDRRRYRRRVVYLIAYLFAIIIPVRITLDLIVSSPKFSAVHFIKPYIIYAIALLALVIWILGLRIVFQRKF